MHNHTNTASVGIQIWHYSEAQVPGQFLKYIIMMTVKDCDLNF